MLAVGHGSRNASRSQSCAIETDVVRLRRRPAVIQGGGRAACRARFGVRCQRRDQQQDCRDMFFHGRPVEVSDPARQTHVSVRRMTLYSGPLSMFGAKAEIATREKGIDFELVMVPFEMATLYQPKHPEVLRINPRRQVPVLVDDGPGGNLEIFDSTQIFEYLETIVPEPALWPAEPKARARARLLEHKSDEVYFPPIVRLMGLQSTPDDPAAVEARAAADAFYD